MNMSKFAGNKETKKVELLNTLQKRGSIQKTSGGTFN
jgi:hypothetical protein